MAHQEFPNTPSMGYEDITVNGVTRLNPPYSEQSQLTAQTAIVQCQRATARLRIDGGDPTVNSGYMLRAGETLELSAERVAQSRFIADTNTPPVLSVHYFMY